MTGRGEGEGSGVPRGESRRAAEPSRADPPAGDPAHDEPAPFLGSWALLYGVVFLNLVALIALFTWFTRAFE